VTHFWENIFKGNSPDEAGAIEEAQGRAQARAAAATPTLEHYIWGTLADAGGITGGRVPVAHWDYKAKSIITFRESYLLWLLRQRISTLECTRTLSLRTLFGIR
jgi:hypothetical protein